MKSTRGLVLASIAAPLILFGCALAQQPTDIWNQHLYPMMYVDEENLEDESLQRMPYPSEPWNQALECVAKLGVPVPPGMLPPTLIVVPARTIRVRDITHDSLYNEGRPMFVGPSVGYALLHSDAVLAVQRYSKSPSLLRHEALHVILWKLKSAYGHPEEFFDPCDINYGVLP